MKTREQELQDQLIEERARRILDYDDANPEVGMGMFDWVALKEAEEQLNMTHSNASEFKR